MPARGWYALAGVITIALLMVLVVAGIFATGGIKFVIIHLMYIPIILAGFMFGIRGGILAGMIAGYIAGPHIPVDIVTGEMQPTLNWLIRLGFFALIGGIAGFISFLIQKQIQQLHYTADHNADTQLPNRHHLEKTLQVLLSHPHDPFYLVTVAIDNFNEIANVFGHHATDEVIQKIETKIRQRFPVVEYCAHYHPERIALIVDKREADKLRSSSRPLLELLEESFTYQEINIHVEPVIGFVASTIKPHPSPLELIQMADVAMFQAKLSHLPSLEYTSDLSEGSEETMRYLGQLRHAIKSDELMLMYQPQIDFVTQQVIGAECLIRWNHPEYGMIGPGKFIPQAEQTELIQPLTRFIIEGVYADIAHWNNQGLHLKISINLATRNLQDPTLLEFIAQMRHQYHVDPHEVTFEVTESSIMDDTEHAAAFMRALKHQGYTLAIDDYGTGYASLAYLKLFPIDYLKIDMAFIRDIDKDTYSQEIVKSTLMMAHGLGLKVVAEGVETPEAIHILKSMGCDVAQGYAYAKPMNKEDALRYFESKR